MEATQGEKKPRGNGPVQITVVRGINLKGAKGDSTVTFVRLEFNNIHLGDSPKHELSTGQAVEYNFTSSFECNAEGPVSLDDIAHKPVILTVIEVLPKEKKQKEEKTLVLAQATMGLLPLLQGESNLKLMVPLHSIPSSPLDISRPDKVCFEGGIFPCLVLVTVTGSVSVHARALLSKTQLLNGNLLKVTLEAAYSVPESWIPTGPQYNYVVSLQLPAFVEKENPLVFSNGTLKLGGEKEPTPRPKKWPITNVQVSGALYIPDAFITGGLYEEEDGELNLKEDKDHRTEAETVKKRVTWDIERSCYIDPGAVISLQKRIAESRFWPVEIMRVPLASTTKGKAGKTDKSEEEIPIAFHGVAFVNLVPLLYPGVKRMRGAFRVYAFNESEVVAKTKFHTSVMRDILRRTSLASRLGVAPPGVGSPHAKGPPSRAQKEDKAPKDTMRKMSITGKTSESVVPESERPGTAQNMEGQQYVDSGTYIVLELLLDKPLVPKREPEELARRVNDLIPPRPQLMRRSAGARSVGLPLRRRGMIQACKSMKDTNTGEPQLQAESDYHSQIVSITNSILNEYRVLFGQQVADGKVLDNQTLEEQKCQLNYELNCTGKYFAFKEQLKHAVVKIVREKYMKTTAFEDPDKLQSFLSDLYVYLVDQMHVALNQMLTDDSTCPPPPSFLDSEQLRQFAWEAEINENFQQAASYYQERLARDRQRVEHWLDYGIFNLLIEDNIEAQECFQEAMRLDQRNLHSVLLCGITSVLQEHYAEAEIFFENATSIDPTSIVAWTLLGLFYEIQDNDIQMDMAFQEACKLRQANIEKDRASALAAATVLTKEDNAAHAEVTENAGADVQPAQEPDPGVHLGSHSSIQMTNQASIFMETIDFLIRVNAVQMTILGSGRPDVINTKQLGGLTEERPTSTLKMEYCKEVLRDPSTWVELFSAYDFSGDCPERELGLQLVQQALAHELLSQDGGPSCKYYLALAKTHLQKKEFAEAEEDLTAAAQINYQNPDVWAMTGHLHFLRDNKTEAKACYERTLSFVTDASETHPVFLRLGSIYLQEGEYKKAKDTYLHACKISPTCLTWLGTGIACYRLGDMAEAEAALAEANTLNNSDAVVWGYLALVCLKTGRQLEAEQSYKYMMKLNLQDEALLREVHEMQELVGFGNPSF